MPPSSLAFCRPSWLPSRAVSPSGPSLRHWPKSSYIQAQGHYVDSSPLLRLLPEDSSGSRRSKKFKSAKVPGTGSRGEWERRCSIYCEALQFSLYLFVFFNGNMSHCPVSHSPFLMLHRQTWSSEGMNTERVSNKLNFAIKKTLASGRTWRMLDRRGESGDVRLLGRQRHSTLVKVNIWLRVNNEHLDLSNDWLDLRRTLGVEVTLHVHAVHLYNAISFFQTFTRSLARLSAFRNTEITNQ